MDGAAVIIALKLRKRRHNQTYWLRYMRKKKSIIMGLLLVLIVTSHLKKVNTSKVKDVELLSVQGKNSLDTLFVNVNWDIMILKLINILVISWWNPRHYLTLNVVQSMLVIMLNFLKVKLNFNMKDKNNSSAWNA